MPMDLEKCNLFLPGFELTGYVCTEQRDFVLRCTSIVLHLEGYVVSYFVVL